MISISYFFLLYHISDYIIIYTHQLQSCAIDKLSAGAIIVFVKSMRQTQQGFNKLAAGLSRKLTKTEFDRGYLFLSRNRNILSLKNVDVHINGRKIGMKSVDHYGRIGLGKTHTSEMWNKNIEVHLKKTGLYITY